MANHVETDITVQRFGFTGDEQGRRLNFPRAEAHHAAGRSGTVAYGAEDLLFDGLEGRLDTLRWTADALSLGTAWLRDDAGRFDIRVERIEMSRGAMLTRADRGVEIVAPHVTLSEMKLAIKGPFGRREPPADAAKPVAKPATPELRQDRLKFLDSLSGRIDLTIKVVLDLPVLGIRTLDQALEIPINEGSLDYRALDDSLNWLGGAFLDIQHEGDKLALTWKVPIFGSTRDLVAWRLDEAATTLASFGRMPVRSFADFVMTRDGDKSRDKKASGILQALSLEAIDIALNLCAPRSLDVGGGLVMFGGEDQPGLVDLEVRGTIRDNGPGSLTGAIGSVDTTIKDVRIGPAKITADRLHFDGLDGLEVTFNGFRPEKVNVVVHRVSATSLRVQLAGRGA